MGTRMIGCQPLIFDHAAQFFTVNDSRFGELVDVQCSDFGGAFVRGVDSVLWMANNSTKLLSSQSDGSHYWTFFNTAAYGERKQGKYGSRGQMGQDPTNQLYEAKPKNKREP
ncbi:hypothetical protein WN944_027316 [Citrus x changshan-huyou]|uniref:Uncharacterized protein n=1 Tax=Citrus x changshan-huyou TaxID=2935761 RepID=A0AAP0Q8E5_9ROSI